MTVGAVNNSRERTGSGALFVGGLAAILASTCCLGPLLLVAVGLSGAWILSLAWFCILILAVTHKTQNSHKYLLQCDLFVS